MALNSSLLKSKISKMSVQLNIYLNHFPKHEKYALCNTIRNQAYNLLSIIVIIEKKYNKKTHLTDLDIACSDLKHMLKLSYDLGYFSFKDGKRENSKQESIRKYKVVADMIDEIGRMIGGWIKNNNTLSSSSTV